MVGSWSPAAWDVPSVGSLFPSLILGGIPWVFFRVHMRRASMLGLDSREPVEHQRVWYENNEHNGRTRSKWHGIIYQSICMS
jgi:hypothetical protein